MSGMFNRFKCEPLKNENKNDIVAKEEGKKNLEQCIKERKAYITWLNNVKDIKDVKQT